MVVQNDTQKIYVIQLEIDNLLFVCIYRYDSRWCTQRFLLYIRNQRDKTNDLWQYDVAVQFTFLIYLY